MIKQINYNNKRLFNNQLLSLFYNFPKKFEKEKIENSFKSFRVITKGKKNENKAK